MLLKVILQNGVGLEPFEFCTNEPVLLLLVFGSAAHYTKYMDSEKLLFKVHLIYRLQ
jgi:hypothetical protein